MRDTIEMAREAGFVENAGNVYGDHTNLKAFEALVRADERSVEREACAKVCEDSVPTYLKNGERWLKGQNGKPDVRLKEIAPNLEAAWEAEQLLKNGSVLESYSVQHQCANAIRARGVASKRGETK